MIDHGRVRSTVRPKPVVIDDFSVWIHKNITEISENLGEENEFIGYEYNMTQYDKNEFILKLVEELEVTQEALLEVILNG